MPKVSKMTVNFELLILKVPSSILSQEVVTSLPHNHATLINLFVSSYCYQILAVKTT